MEIIVATYLSIMFIALYFFSFFAILTIKNRKKLFYSPTPKKNYSISIVIPCYNEGSTIKGNLNALLAQDYPNLKKIIVVDDCSTDNSFKIIKDFAKKHPKIMIVQTPKNTGNAAGAKNYGASFVKTELIGFSDADSYPAKDAISKMVGFFNEEQMAAVTSFVPIRNRNASYLSKIQSLEYMFMGFFRKLLDFIDSVYVTNGPLSIYRKSIFDKIGGFDEESITEDIEITWHMLSKDYKTAMSLGARVSTEAPTKIKPWFNQRTRWGLGGLQAIAKYKEMFFKKGLFGAFILPFVSLTIILSLFTFLFSVYLFTKSIITSTMITIKSTAYNAPIFKFANFNYHPSILIFYLIVLFIASMTMYNYILKKTNHEDKASIKRFFNMLFYLLIYGTLYPIVWFKSIYRYIVKDNKW
ncbi:MAG: glycosyltransferase [Nanoarchaeota archaeon]|nr:glycosyltransferase [Nanoarchaeota archaeon]